MLLKQIKADYFQLKYYYRDSNLWAISSFKILISFRIRQAAIQNRIPIVNGILAFIERALYGIEISKNATLGAGVIFLHPVGTVIGANAKIGIGTVFCGSNTVGTRWPAEGIPTIGSYVQIGCGAKILGHLTIGDNAQIGANAVVIKDVPSNTTAVGVPAKIC